MYRDLDGRGGAKGSTGFAFHTIYGFKSVQKVVLTVLTVVLTVQKVEFILLLKQYKQS